MTNNIKQLKPSKTRGYKQGYVNPKTCKKLFESQQNTPIIYRSSYERKFIQWLEHSNTIKRWGSECIKIDYINAYDNKPHHYYPDYVVEMSDGTLFLIEVKPYNQTQQPDPTLPKDCYAWKTYITNMSKWKYAQEFCEKNGFKFKIITERSIDRM